MFVKIPNPSDLDECSIGNGACDQECFNSVGGHTCGCWTGYYLSSDQRSCSGKDSYFITFRPFGLSCRQES